MILLNLSPSAVLVAIFLVLLLKTVTSAVGKSAILDWSWAVYTRLASKAGHAKFVALAEKRHELLRVNAQRKAISAQDQYAKWTKLNRQFDKLNAEVAALVEGVSAERLSVTKATGFALTAATAAPVWFARFWYRKQVLFYFPQGVWPYPVEWLLALPFTATGGLGLTVWMFAVNSLLSSLTFLVKYYSEPAVENPEEEKTAPVTPEAAAAAL